MPLFSSQVQPQNLIIRKLLSQEGRLARAPGAEQHKISFSRNSYGSIDHGPYMYAVYGSLSTRYVRQIISLIRTHSSIIEHLAFGVGRWAFAYFGMV